MTTEYVSNREKAHEMQDKYREWKIQSMRESGYFLIFQGFLDNDILRNISGNGLKLYLYLGIKSSNLEGVVWYSNEKIAKYFNKSERTIRTWMNELEKLKLIKRMRLDYDGNAYTYLIPYKTNYSDRYSESVEGTLINERGKLFIYYNNKYISVSSGVHIEIYDHITDEWVYGKIAIDRGEVWDEDDVNVKYVFISFKDNLKIQLDGSKKFSVKAVL